MTSWTLPPEFDPAAYRLLHPAFAHLHDEQLLDHYVVEGRREGFPSNGLQHRGEFAALLPASALTLEIGPFASPVLRGENVRYCDVLDTDGLRRRAREIGIDASGVPQIHHVMGRGLLDDVTGSFDAVLSSHSIAHQPDLVGHLQQVERRLASDGRYLVLVPDKRFCFDHDIAPSTIAEVLQAHEERRTVHSLRSVIEHRCLTVHNDSTVHWERREEVCDGRAVQASKVRDAIEEHRASQGAYIDVHAWYFTPDSFRHIIRLLGEIGLVQLKLERLYRTRRPGIEFWAILSREPGPAGRWDAAANGDEKPGSDAPFAPRRSSTPPAPTAMAAPRRRGLLARTLRAAFARR